MALLLKDLLYGPAYTAFGVTATITPLASAAFDVTVIDKTAGVEIEGKGNVGLMTVRPAAYVKAADIQTQGLHASDLDDAEVALNGRTWTVKAVKPLPTPNGTYDGQFALILSEDGTSADD